MNAATKVAIQTDLFQGEWQGFSISWPTVLFVGLLFSILLSALLIVYTKNLERQLVSDLQYLKQQSNQLQLESSQLVLEHSTWVAPGRLQQLAQEQLAMRFPERGQVVVMRQADFGSVDISKNDA